MIKPLPESPSFEQLNQGYDVVFHIGAPKTGTSAIQKHLLENRQTLKTFGFYYPEHWLDKNGVSGGHTSFGLSIKQGNLPGARAALDSWMNQAKQQDLTLLISAESLFFHPEKLKEMTPDLRLKVLVFYRSPIDNIYSNYNQSVRNRFITATFEQFCVKRLQANSDFYTGRSFKQWIELFGEDSVIAVGYNPDLFDTLPIQTQFLMMLGVSDAGTQTLTPSTVHYVNRRYSSNALELKRLLNHVLAQDNSKLNQRINQFLQRLSDESPQPEVDLTSILSDAVRNRFMEKYQLPSQQAMEKHLTPIKRGSHITSVQDTPSAAGRTGEPLAMQDILERLRSEHPDLFSYIATQCTHAIQNQASTRPLLELSNLLDIITSNTEQPGHSFC